MSTTEPKPGEWWWVEVASTPGKVCPMKLTDEGHWHNGIDSFAQHEIHLLDRIPEPPAPEPTEAEKIDVRRVDALLEAQFGPETAQLAVDLVSQSDEAAGYVLVPTSGPGFDEMVRAMRRAMDRDVTVTYAGLLRAALEAVKGDVR